jgi:hypothetical protein
MSSSSMGPEGESKSHSKESDAAKSPEKAAGDPTRDRAMMEEVLKRTLDQPANSLDSAERDSLVALARRHRGEPFELDPVAVDLVEVMLRREFNARITSPDRWRRMCYEVARTLFDDPAAHQRMQAIWTGICAIEP